MAPASRSIGGRRRYSVCQWSTGNVGARALRRVIEHSDLDLVGVHVHNPDKVGVDAGRLAGTTDTGVRATDRLEDVLAMKPDCVLHMSHVFNLDEICALLEAGINVVSTRVELQHPSAFDRRMAARLEAAALSGKSSIHATGSSPGFITEALPIVLASMQRRLEQMRIDEYADVSSRNSAEMIFETMGFGRKAETLGQAQLEHARFSFTSSLQLFSDAVGLPLERYEVSGQVGLAREDVRIAAGVVPAGTVAAIRTTVTGIRHDRPFMELSGNWYVSKDVEPIPGVEWDFRLRAGWHVAMLGDVPLDVTIAFPVEDEHFGGMTPGLTAHRPVNAIPYVCEAEPGIVTIIDLPQIVPRLLEGPPDWRVGIA